MQDVFVKIWDVRARLEIKQNFRSYLFRVCHNRAIDVNKEIAVRNSLFEQLLYHYQALPDIQQYSEEDWLKYDALVEKALDSLTPQRRKIYEMVKKEKKSYEEVARELNISPNTVKATVTQTLALLRHYLNDHLNFAVIILLIRKIL